MSDSYQSIFIVCVLEVSRFSITLATCKLHLEHSSLPNPDKQTHILLTGAPQKKKKIPSSRDQFKNSHQVSNSAQQSSNVQVMSQQANHFSFLFFVESLLKTMTECNNLNWLRRCRLALTFTQSGKQSLILNTC